MDQDARKGRTVSERLWTVTALISEINSLLEEGFSGIRVEGELTNVSRSARGHVYFSLKDGAASLDCVMWATRAGRLKFEIEDGLAIIATGSLTIYPQRGRFQMVVDTIEPQGIGALQLAFEQLKRRLTDEGLFDVERKRQLPALPSRVGIVTSLSGAALHDMLNVLLRFPHLEVVVAPAAVQGDGAANEIARAVDRLAGSGLVDVVIVGRGGGSLEDLWAFNEEEVARAIAASAVPVISGVGHEVDFTIADFVADVRATTPTQAAEIVVARLEEQSRRLAEAEIALARDLRRRLELSRARLVGLAGSAGLARVPQKVRRLADRLQRADRLPALVLALVRRSAERCERAESILRRLPARVAAGGHARFVAGRRQQLVQLMRGRIVGTRASVAAGERALGHLNPHRVLQRGYSITTVEGDRTPLRDAARVRAGQALWTVLAKGTVRSLVAGTAKGSVRRKVGGSEQISLFDDEISGES
jgi:exodeoxyribonuclease VII large subunit